MIIVVGGIKGGTGKTTIATNLTVLRSAQNKKVLLVDADEQKSASDWAQQREALGILTKWSTIQLAGKAIFSQLQRMSQDYDDIIVDVGGRDTTSQRSSLSIADILLLPFKPRSLDIWTIGSVKQMISEMKATNPKLKCLAIINQADPKGKENLEAESIISKCPDLKFVPSFLGQRKAFSNASSDGLGIHEIVPADPKAINEFNSLYNYIYNT